MKSKTNARVYNFIGNPTVKRVRFFKITLINELGGLIQEITPPNSLINVILKNLTRLSVGFPIKLTMISFTIYDLCRAVCLFTLLNLQTICNVM